MQINSWSCGIAEMPSVAIADKIAVVAVAEMPNADKIAGVVV